MVKNKLPMKKGKWKKAIAIGAAALAATGALWYITTANGLKVSVPSYRAIRVIDGDTFETEERQLIRLTGIDAPELNNCDGPESKKALENLIINKNLYVKVIFRDSNNRLISHVYNDNGLVSNQMLELGMAYGSGNAINDPSLRESARDARNKKIGIYSSKCTQVSNPNSKSCVIKGNVSYHSSRENTYHFPGCGEYNQTLVELYKGDKWFCTEAEAKKAGFIKGADCFDKVWK